LKSSVDIIEYSPEALQKYQLNFKHKTLKMLPKIICGKIAQKALERSTE
jgi:hypothetical protein